MSDLLRKMLCRLAALFLAGKNAIISITGSAETLVFQTNTAPTITVSNFNKQLNIPAGVANRPTPVLYIPPLRQRGVYTMLIPKPQAAIKTIAAYYQTAKNMIMKKNTVYAKYFIGITLVLLAFLLPTAAIAQNDSPTVTYYQHWTKLFETKKHVDVFYRVIKCGNGPAQVHIKIYNEGVADEVLNFNLEVTNMNGEKISKLVNISTIKGRNYLSDCGSAENEKDLKIELPANFYGYTVKISTK